MKNISRFIGVTILLFVGITSGWAQIQIPAASPGSTLKETVGLTNVTIEYSRPSMRGRDLFTDLTPIGKVWRTGANLSTKITFSGDVVLNENQIPAGTYSMYSIPGEHQWTVIINKKISWGTEYDSTQDLVRIKVPTIISNEKVEAFTFYMTPVSDVSAVLGFKWGNAKVEMNISTNDRQKVLDQIAEVMKNPDTVKPNDYWAAASYYYSINKDLQKALDWVNIYLKNAEDAYWGWRMKAQIQAKLGDYKSAITTAQKAIDVANQQGNQDYVRYTKLEMESYKKGKTGY